MVHTRLRSLYILSNLSRHLEMWEVPDHMLRFLSGNLEESIINSKNLKVQARCRPNLTAERAKESPTYMYIMLTILIGYEVVGGTQLFILKGSVKYSICEFISNGKTHIYFEIINWSSFLLIVQSFGIRNEEKHPTLVLLIDRSHTKVSYLM